MVILPASLLGLLVLLALLVCLGRVPQALQDVSQFFLSHLSVFFIPALVASWLYIDRLQDKLWLFLFSIVISTVLSLIITTWLAKRLLLSKVDDKRLDDHE
jgi:holin-like protein